MCMWMKAQVKLQLYVKMGEVVGACVYIYGHVCAYVEVCVYVDVDKDGEALV